MVFFYRDYQEDFNLEMNQCLSVLASLSLGLSIGAGGTAIGNSWWVKHNGNDINGGKYYMGLWSICLAPPEQDALCNNTWERDSIKDSRKYTALFIYVNMSK